MTPGLGSPAAAVKASVPAISAPKAPSLTARGDLSQSKPRPATSAVHPASSLPGDRSASLPPPPGGGLAPVAHSSPPTRPAPSMGEPGSIFNKGASMPSHVPYTPHPDFDHLVKQAAAAGLARSKAAAEVCDDDDSSKEEKKKEKKEKDEEKSASIRKARALADMNSKLASVLKHGSDAALPTSDISNVSGSIPPDFGAGRQQPKTLKGLPGDRDLPTTDMTQAGTQAASGKIAGLAGFLRKRANETAASIHTMSAEQGPSGGTPVEGGVPSHIGSNQALIDSTKATGSPAKRKDLAEAFQEPALTRSTDSTVSDAFQNTPGDKMASARDLFTRLQREASR